MDEWCRLYGCRHRLIPIGEKELNGKVENTHKYDDEEFYSQRQYQSFEKLETQTREYNEDWNENRKTKTLGWRSPAGLVEEIKTTILVLRLYALPDPAPTELVEIPAVEITKNHLPAQLITPLDRYLAWMAWDAAQYHKSAPLIVSGMSQIFARSLGDISVSY